MKTKLLLIVLVASVLFGCVDAGTATQKLNGNEPTLPDELKGLKVYSVSLGDGDAIKIAILNGTVNSATYTEGKVAETTIVVNNEPVQKENVEILSELESLEGGNSNPETLINIDKLSKIEVKILIDKLQKKYDEMY